jgi:DNA-binding MarR family transcriptional regulator
MAGKMVVRSRSHRKAEDDLSAPAPDSRLQDFSLRDAPGHLLRRNHQRSFEIFHKHVGDKITRQQFALLVTLNQNPGASQKDLVDATGIDKSTLKEMLGRMIDRDWILRTRDPRDSRAWAMQITDGGLAVLNEYVDKVAAAQREIIAPLNPDEQALFLHFLNRLVGIDPDA